MESSENAIEVRNVSKHFKVFYDKGNELKERMLFWKRNKFELRKVLDNISFSIKKGEAVGLVGKNGCGKSTTLKLLTKIIYPSSGSIELKGRVSSLIELGAGFHPDMSGRENIYINASIFGLTKKEIDERIEDIIDFSELRDYIDNPVRTYSSGMYMRLAFSVAINVNADVLLIDEILAVGDANFQAKCFNKLREIKKSGVTIVIVSHSLGQIELFCDKSIWIKEGHVEMIGEPKDVHLKYLDYMNELQQAKLDEENVNWILEQNKIGDEELDKYKFPPSMKGDHSGDARAVFVEKALVDADGNEKYTFETGESFKMKLKYRLRQKIEDTVFGFGIFRADGLWVHGTNTRIDRFSNFDIDKDGGYSVQFNDVNLIPGKYWIDITIEYGDGIPVDYYRHAIEFNVVSHLTDVGVVRFDHEWELDI
ncbi:MAG: ABC transporter ATP-binding protein [Lachnospiraceae bacterium]|nr:ABC transporter ATP-binding protein [Lachnospiraceae bacterium]